MTVKLPLILLVAATAYSQITGGSTGGPATLDGSSFDINEDFPGAGAANSGTVGTYGWLLRPVGGGTCSAPQAGTGTYFPHLGIVALTGGATVGMGCVITLDPGGTSPFSGTIVSTWSWDSYFDFAAPSNTTIQLRVGFLVSLNSAAIPTSGLYVRYDTTLGTPDTQFMLCSTTASVETCQTTGVNADTAFHKVRIRWITQTTIGMTFYDTSGVVQTPEVTFCPSGCTVTVTLPITTMAPSFEVVTATAANRYLYCDFFKFRATGLQR